MGCGASKAPVVEDRAVKRETRPPPAPDSAKKAPAPFDRKKGGARPFGGLAAPVEKPVIAGPVVFVLGNDACGKVRKLAARWAAPTGATVLLRNAVESAPTKGASWQR